jgi:predicted dehydrogenase
VVIATPNHAHARAAESALAAGRHVLVEKPICARAADAFALVELAKSVSPCRALFVGHSERFNPVVRVLARLLEGDTVIALDFARVGKRRTGHAPSPRDESGALATLGVHDLDLAAYLARSPIELREAVGACGAPPARAEDLAHALVTSASGVPAHVYVDRTAHAARRTITVVTPRWIYEGDLLLHRLKRTSRTSGESTAVPLPTEEPLVAQALAAADAIRGTSRGPREIALGMDGARALALAERAARRVREADPAALHELRRAVAEKL